MFFLFRLPFLIVHVCLHGVFCLGHLLLTGAIPDD